MADHCRREPLPLDDFRPRSMLTVDEHLVNRPAFPVIDAHNHAWSQSPAEVFVANMDRCGVEKTVILDAGPGAETAAFIRDWVGPHADRFIVFTNPPWEQVNDPAFPDLAARALAEAVECGARGLKIPKGLGLGFRDTEGRLIPIDDERLDPLWAKCGELGVPICIHTGDPAAFFEPLDGTNERWDELHARPDWHFHGRDLPPLEDLLWQLRRAVRRHPGTIFYGAHVGGYAENLKWVAEMLDECPNYYVDLSERIPELGRQPRTARRFLIDYQDRILFGTDRPATEDHVLPTWFRLLETADEYFPYSPDPIPRQGRWRVYGLDLPQQVLQKVYAGNVRGIIPDAAG